MSCIHALLPIQANSQLPDRLAAAQIPSRCPPVERWPEAKDRREWTNPAPVARACRRLPGERTRPIRAEHQSHTGRVQTLIGDRLAGSGPTWHDKQSQGVLPRARKSWQRARCVLQGPARRGSQARCGWPAYQQMRGKGSPTSMSITRVPP